MHKICFLGALLLASCSLPKVERTAAECPAPPPPPSCTPGAFSTVTFDTSATGGWRIERVYGASSGNVHEWGIIRTTGQTLLMLGTDPSQPTYAPVVQPAPDIAERTSARQAGGMFLLTRIHDGAMMGDASIAQAQASGDSIVLQQPLPTPVNLPVYWDGHPTVQGNIMVFSSERPGSIGGADLWYSTWKNGSWSEPVNLGPDVNTPCDEISPQFAANGSTLLFSSAGHATAGGYDVFTSQARYPGKDSLVVSGVRNIGLPVNTPADEIFPSMPDDRILTYGSNQESASDFDVYVLYPSKPGTPRRTDRTATRRRTQDEPVQAPTDSVPTANVTGTVTNEKTDEPVVNAQVTARDSATRKVVARTYTDSTGAYTIKVPTGRGTEITAQAPDLFYQSYTINLPKEQAEQTVVRKESISLPNTFTLRVNFPTSAFDEPYEMTLDSNGNETQRRWVDDIDLVASNIKASGDDLQKVILIGHTDDVDTDANNLVLGRQRVDFIIAELVKRGVPADMLEGRSAGERLKPDKRKTESTDQWRKRSRRVELVKVMRK